MSCGLLQKWGRGVSGKLRSAKGTASVPHICCGISCHSSDRGSLAGCLAGQLTLAFQGSLTAAGLLLAGKVIQANADVSAQVKGVLAQGTAKAGFQTAQHLLGIIRPKTGAGHLAAGVSHGGDLKAVGQNLGGLIVLLLPEQTPHLYQIGISGLWIFPLERGIHRTCPVPAASLDKGFGRAGQPCLAARHIPLALPGGSNAKFCLALDLCIAQGTVKGLDGIVPAGVLQTLHPHPKVVHRLICWLKQTAVCFEGFVKGSAVSLLRTVAQAGQQRTCCFQMLELAFQFRDGIGPGQQGTGPTTKGA